MNFNKVFPMGGGGRAYAPPHRRIRKIGNYVLLQSNFSTFTKYHNNSHDVTIFAYVSTFICDFIVWKYIGK